MTDTVEKFITWGYGERCETKDLDDIPELKGRRTPRCPTCEIWEQYDEFMKLKEVL